MSYSIPLSCSPQVLQNYRLLVLRLTKPLGSEAADLHHASTGMATEAGEALSTTKKIWVYGQQLDTVNKEGSTHRANLVEEIGDALFYIQGMCNLLDISLLDAMTHNMEKLTLRYPEGYSDAAAAQRADKITAKQAAEADLQDLPKDPRP